MQSNFAKREKRKQKAMGNVLVPEPVDNERYLDNIPEDNGSHFFGKQLPEEVICHIFLHVPARDLVRNAMRVCKYWNIVLQQYHFWWKKMECENISMLQDTREKLLADPDEKFVLYVLQGLCTQHLPFNRNIIMNPCGADKKNHWKCQPHTMICVEDSPVGSDPIPDDAEVPTQHCFSTSYNTSSRTQIIHLPSIGVQPKLMDVMRPKIYVSEWVSARFDCRSESHLEVEIHGKMDSNVKLTKDWSSDDEGIMLRKWYKIEMEVTDYPEGVYKLKYRSVGRDRQFWAGFYGAKSTGSTLKLII